MMPRTAFWRVVWKEYRMQRAFWLAMVLLIVLLQLVAVAVAANSQRPGELTMFIPFLIAMTLPALYAAGCGATMFATEHEEGTYEFQRTLPAAPLGVLLGKVAVGMSSAYALLGLAYAAAAFLCWCVGVEPSAADTAALWRVWWFVPLEMLAWGIVFSLLSTGPLAAALLAITFGSVVFYVLDPRSLGDWWRHAAPFGIRVGIVAILAAVIVRLAQRWFREPPAPVERILGLLRRPESVEKSDIASCGAALRRNSVFFRLLWQQWRQSIPMMGAIGLLALVIGTFMTWLTYDAPGGLRQHLSWAGLLSELLARICGVAALMGGGVAALMGACVFHGDQRGGGLRFLAEHGARAGSVWRSRQLVWIVPLAVLAVLLVSFFLVQNQEFGRGFSRLMSRTGAEAPESTYFAAALEWIYIYLGLLLLAYACGQLCSMFLRSGLLAAVFGVLLAGLLSAWAGLMLALDVSWIWSVWPIPIAMLVATRLRTANWLLERNTLRAWAAPAACVLVPMLALLIAVPCYRVYSIPAVDPGFSPEQYARPLSPEAEATTKAYERARMHFRYPKAPTEDPQPHDQLSNLAIDENLAERRAEWVKANKETIALAVKASHQPTCQCFDTTTFRAPLMWFAHDLGWLLIAAGQEAQRAGELDKAAEYYLAALRVSEQMRGCDLPGHSWQVRDPDRAEAAAYVALVAWAAQPKQTSERITNLMHELDTLDRLRQPPSDAIKLSYLVTRALIMVDQTQLESMGRRSRDIFGMVLWNYLLPWEKYRSLRVLNLVTKNELEHWNEKQALANGVSVARTEEYGSGFEPHASPLYSFFLPSWDLDSVSPDSVEWRLGRDFAVMTTCRRALRVQLALEAWKAKHGKLPKSLKELVGTYLDKLPEDPFTGKPLEYFPEGVAVPTWQPPVVSSTWSDRGYRVGSEVSAGTPIVWSAGPRVLIAHREPGDRRRPEYLLMQPRTRLSDIEAWMHGWAFPVP